MHNSILIELIHNIAVLIAFSLLYDYSWLKNEKTRNFLSKLLIGLSIGGIGIFIMLTPWTLVPGIQFDTRSILLSTSGLFFGTVPTIIAMFIMGIFRYLLGGAGMWMGLAVIFCSGVIGILWRKFRPFAEKKNYWLELLAMGFVVHIVMLACTVFIPAKDLLLTLKTIALPVILIYPPGTMLLGILMVKQYNNWQNRKAKEELLKSERRFREMFGGVNLLSIILDEKGIIIFCNQYFLDITGYSQEEVIGGNWFETFIIPERRDEIKLVFDGILQEQEFSWHYDNDIISKDGTKLIISWNNTLLREEDHGIIGIAAIGENITERKASETQKMRLANILESSLNELYVFDEKTLYFDYVNYGGLKNLGYTLEEMKKLTPVDIKPDFTLDSFNELIRPLRDQERSLIVFETRHRRADGTFYPVEVHLQLFTYNDEHIFLAVIQDISVRKHTETQLIEARDKAEESDRLKSIFLANMSHEIRTPMNTIMGFSDLLSERDLSEDKKAKYTRIIHNSGNRLMQLINDIIDISKLEAKQLSIKLSECDIYEIFTTSVEAFRKNDLLESKPQVELRLNLPDKYSRLLFKTDNNRFQQILDNLISNAIKYTKKGFVEAGFEIKSENNVQFIQTYVKDTGMGIPKEMNEIIFERFRQIEEGEYHEGVGLGLSICKGIVELLGGQIWFHSEIDKGTTFYFTVPYASSGLIVEKIQPSKRQNDIDLSGKTIIIAEDDESSFDYLYELLKDQNVKIIHAENGGILMSLLEYTLPDLILLDINMPVKSGFECLKEIRSKGLKLNIVAQTAYAMTEEKEKCFQAGCQGYISKPVDRKVLFDEIKKVLSPDPNE